MEVKRRGFATLAGANAASMLMDDKPPDGLQSRGNPQDVPNRVNQLAGLVRPGIGEFKNLGQGG